MIRKISDGTNVIDIKDFKELYLWIERTDALLNNGKVSEQVKVIRKKIKKEAKIRQMYADLKMLRKTIRSLPMDANYNDLGILYDKKNDVIKAFIKELYSDLQDMPLINADIIIKSENDPTDLEIKSALEKCLSASEREQIKDYSESQSSKYIISHNLVYIDETFKLEGYQNVNLVEGILNASLKNTHVKHFEDKLNMMRCREYPDYSSKEKKRFEYDSDSVISIRRLFVYKLNAEDYIFRKSNISKEINNLYYMKACLNEMYYNRRELSKIINSLNKDINKFDTALLAYDSILRRIEKMFKDELKEQQKKPGIVYKKDDEQVTIKVNNKTSEEYNQYTSARNRLDMILEKRDQFESDEQFQKTVEASLGNYGNSCDGIIKNITYVRKNLEVNSFIKSIIKNIEDEFESQTEMLLIQENGLTAFESMALQKLAEIQTDHSISADAFKEINYYIIRYDKVIQAFSSLTDSENISEEDKEEITKELREKYCINTILCDEIAAIKEQS